jgi:hypothetical protein
VGGQLLNQEQKDCGYYIKNSFLSFISGRRGEVGGDVLQEPNNLLDCGALRRGFGGAEVANPKNLEHLILRDAIIASSAIEGKIQATMMMIIGISLAVHQSSDPTDEVMGRRRRRRRRRRRMPKEPRHGRGQVSIAISISNSISNFISISILGLGELIGISGWLLSCHQLQQDHTIAEHIPHCANLAPSRFSILRRSIARASSSQCSFAAPCQ